MQPAALRALEFDRVREALARDAQTPLGRAWAFALEPSPEADVVQARLDLAVEATAFVRAGGSLGLTAPEDLVDILGGLGIADRPLEPLELLGLAAFLDSVSATAAGLRRAASPMGSSDVPAFPRLKEIARSAASFDVETARVRRAIHSTGDISDDASPALRDIRDALRRQRARLRATLENLTRGRDSAKYLQDQIITDRHGRYVVMVRAEHRESVPGIVHGSSASGASLFLEPLGTVDLNNDVVTLAEREKEEIARILLALTDAFRARGDELDGSIDVAAQVDALHATARLAQRLDGTAPALSDDARIEFRGARHPLLMLPRPAEPGDDGDGDRETARRGPIVPVASDLLVVPPTRALVISGPNTGGKTVALKAIGLLAMMAQAGLLIPVDRGSRFTPLRSVFADIGDDQSISASLSTFSARIAHIVAMDRALEVPALVLLDELGGGTDPTEGGALGAAVIDHFRNRGALLVATTHDDGLKSYAATTSGVTTAAFGFEADSYAPTYRLIYGAPGRSLALEIAARLGMPASVIAAARERRSQRETQLDAHLARVDSELAGLERDRRSLADERAASAAERQRLIERESRLAEREAILKKRFDDRLNEKIREARGEVDRVIGQLKTKAEALSSRATRGTAPLSTGEVGELRAEARGALESIGAAIAVDGAGVEEPAGLETPPAIGDRVLIATLGAEGIVRGVSGQRADVEVRGKRMRVALVDLRQTGKAPAGSKPERKAAAGRVSVDQAPREAGAARELVLIGNTVDEATDRIEKFLDAALLSDERVLRIVHGHGTGRLRDAVREFFKRHPLVASVGPAPDNQGGAGATIVELKE